jgi:hypothetical protein
MKESGVVRKMLAQREFLKKGSGLLFGYWSRGSCAVNAWALELKNYPRLGQTLMAMGRVCYHIKKLLDAVYALLPRP